MTTQAALVSADPEQRDGQIFNKIEARQRNQIKDVKKWKVNV